MGWGSGSMRAASREFRARAGAEGGTLGRRGRAVWAPVPPTCPSAPPLCGCPRCADSQVCGESRRTARGPPASHTSPSSAILLVAQRRRAGEGSQPSTHWAPSPRKTLSSGGQRSLVQKQTLRTRNKWWQEDVKVKRPR